MLLRTAFRVSILMAALTTYGCSSTAQNQQSEHYAQPSTPNFLQATPTPRPTINPDQAAGLVSRFYRDVNDHKVEDIEGIASSDFLSTHNKDWFADYGWIQDPKLQVKSVNGQTVSYLLDYTYPTKSGELFWERTGVWALNHGAQSGWVLDKDTWDSIHLIGISTSPTGPMIPVKDSVSSDGRHEFDFMGERFSFLADNKSWHITAIGEVSSSHSYQPTTTVTVNQNGTTQTYSGTGDTHVNIPPENAPLPNTGSSCEEASLRWKSEDGDWIGTDDGRKFHVMPGDESEVITWTVTDDLKICGDTIIDVDDEGSQVEIY